jgi:hypothetical protein
MAMRNAMANWCDSSLGSMTVRGSFAVRLELATRVEFELCDCSVCEVLVVVL